MPTASDQSFYYSYVVLLLICCCCCYLCVREPVWRWVSKCVCVSCGARTNASHLCSSFTLMHSHHCIAPFLCRHFLIINFKMRLYLCVHMHNNNNNNTCAFWHTDSLTMNYNNKSEGVRARASERMPLAEPVSHTPFAITHTLARHFHAAILCGQSWTASWAATTTKINSV